MVEELEALDRFGNILKVMERNALLAEMANDFDQTGDNKFALRVVHIMLARSNGKWLIVQRGNTTQNPFMWDMTVGGHIKAGDSFDESALRETEEEIGVKSQIVSIMDYPKTVAATDLTKTAVMRLIDLDPWYQAPMTRRDDGKKWKKRECQAVYVGLYDGPISFPDGEAQNVQELTPNELQDVISKDPDHYMSYLKMFLERYQYYLTKTI